MSSGCCNCKSKKIEKDVSDPTSKDILNIVKRNENEKKKYKIDELNISLHNGIKYREEHEQDFACLSFFDVCYKNDDDITRSNYKVEYAIATISEE